MGTDSPAQDELPPQKGSESTGTEQTRRFYDEDGWTEKGGKSVDHLLFGVKEDGPIRIALHRIHNERVRAALTEAGDPLNLLECGCGGSPERSLLEFCSSYTGVDFSETGIERAKASFADVDTPNEFQTADVCALPFPDGSFDAVYSAHMIYHIKDPAAQEAAIREMVRVVRPGGVVLIIAANPRPLLFPIRLLKRLAAVTPLLGSLLNKLRSKPPLPYEPQSLGWMRRRMQRGGPVRIVAYSLPSTAFYQNVTEFHGFGKLRWKIIQWLDTSYPRLSAYLGNYVLFTCRKDPCPATEQS